jgi:peroxiredoxin/glutaredoxin
MKLKIGQKAPDFTLPSHLDKDITLSQFHGKNVVIAFFPQAWTPVWSEQIPSYEAQKAKFGGLNAQVLGISIDHVPCLKAWADSLGGITYPLLSDFWPHGKIAKKYGVLRKEGYTERAIFILDKEGIIRYIDIHDIDDQPNNEILEEPPQPEPVALPKGGIVMYCTKWCQDCRKARAWFKEQNLDYTEVDIYGVPGALKQAREWGGGKLITPTIDIDGTIILDFDEKRLREVLHR